MNCKKLLAGILSAAMVFTTMAIPAFAEDTETASNWSDVAVTDWYTENETEYTLMTAEQLAGLAQLVNNGTSFAKKTIKLGNDIDLNGKEWTPIGVATYKIVNEIQVLDKTKTFQGTFDGQNKTISNLTISKISSYSGLFGYVTNNSKLCNFTMEKVNAKFGSNCGSVCGEAFVSTMNNVHVKNAKISANYENYVGGLVGHGYMDVSDSSFEGDISGSGMQVGGLVGSGGFTVTNCSVFGDIHGATWIGGIVGNCQDGGAYKNCYVKGTVSSDYAYGCISAGGIVAAPLYSSQKISQCYCDAVVKCGNDIINCPIIGGYNNSTFNASTKFDIFDNSWNRDIYNINSFDIIALNSTTPIQTAKRDNSIVVNESDIKYVGNVNKAVIKNYTGVTNTITTEELANSAVAEVNGTKYTTIADAINEANAGETVNLLADTTVTDQIVTDKNITIDLNGHTLTSDYLINGDDDSRYAFVFNNGATIKNSATDSSKGVLIANKARAIKSNKGLLTLEGATVKVPSDTVEANNAVIGTTGGLTMKDSTVIGGFNESYAVSSFGSEDTYEEYTIENSTISGTRVGIYRNGSAGKFKMSLKNSKIKDGTYGLYISNDINRPYHNVDITDCEITGKGTAIEGKFTNITLTDSTVKAESTEPSYIQNGNGATTSGFAVVITDNSKDGKTAVPEGKITINSGTYTGLIGLENGKDAIKDYTIGKTTASITGGTFNTDVTDYCAYGHEITESNGTYTVKESNIIWTTDTDSGIYTVEGKDFGMMRFMFGVKEVGASNVENIGIKYIKLNTAGTIDSNGKKVEATVTTGTNAVQGDIYGMETTDTNNYYAAAFITVGGKTYWSAPIFCKLNTGRRFTTYAPTTTGGEN